MSSAARGSGEPGGDSSLSMSTSAKSMSSIFTTISERASEALSSDWDRKVRPEGSAFLVTFEEFDNLELDGERGCEIPEFRG
jgi:hypothetical protein